MGDYLIQYNVVSAISTIKNETAEDFVVSGVDSGVHWWNSTMC